MGSIIFQTGAVISMNLKSFGQRFWMTIATLVAVAVVVAVLLTFLAMRNGFQATISSSGSDRVAVVMRQGSQAEINSVLSREQVNIIESAPGIAKDAQGAIVSPELYVVVDGIKRSTKLKANIPLRGIGERGVQLRDKVTIVEGRMFESGKNEIVVGAAILREFLGFTIGEQVKLGQTVWTIVGIFNAKGSVFGSELWADSRVVQNQFNRGGSVQVLRVKLETPGDVETTQNFLNKDPRTVVDVFTEKQFFEEQSSSVSDFIFYLGWPLAICMALGALAGALNTMYTSVSQRAVEIATLRAIGFSGVSAFFGTLVESLIISIAGGVLGTLLTFLFFDGMTASTLGGNFTQIVFDFQINSTVLTKGVQLALLIGLIGGAFPALKAARMPVLTAFKSAP